MTSPALPPASGPGYRIAVVCLGNICRSPVADVVLNDRLAAAGVDATVESFGTGGWHVGEPMDQRSAATLTAAGYDPSRHRAQQFRDAHAAAYDVVLAMDSSHHRELTALGVPAERLLMFRAFDPEGPGDVPDPYYGGPQGFDDVLAMIERTADAIVGALRP